MNTEVAFAGTPSFLRYQLQIDAAKVARGESVGLKERTEEQRLSNQILEIRDTHSHLIKVSRAKLLVVLTQLGLPRVMALASANQSAFHFFKAVEKELGS